MSIREQFKQTEKLYHFTSFETALRIIESNRLRFGRLNNMNDIHENDKIVFVDANNQTIDEFPSDVLDAVYDEIYKYRQVSFSIDSKNDNKEGFDLHQMWGLYAEKGDGVCLVFDKKELESCFDGEIIPDNVDYDKVELKPFVISNSHCPVEVVDEIKGRVKDIFFNKRKEWEHEQEYRLLKRCPNVTREEYLSLGHSLKFIILSSRLRDKDEVQYFRRLGLIKEKSGAIPVLIYGNGFLDNSLITSNCEETIWESENKYKIVLVGKNASLDVDLPPHL